MRKQTQRLALTSLALAGLLTACASKPPAGTPEYDAYMAEQANKAAIARVDDTLKASPDWYRQPIVKPGYLVSAGTDRSADMQFALDKAVLSAKSGLAAQVNSAVSASIKSFIAASTTIKFLCSDRFIYSTFVKRTPVFAEILLPGSKINLSFLPLNFFIKSMKEAS